MRNPLSVKSIFNQAYQYDHTLYFDDQISEELTQKLISPTKYTSDSLFQNLAEGKVSLFSDYPTPYTDLVDKENSKQFIINYLVNLDDDFKYKIHRDLGQQPVRLTISELVKSWLIDDEILRVTNIHTRKTDIPKVLDPDEMCPFNLLNVNCPDISSLEMMTLMVGSTGSFTDSHSDDADVNNHCIVGKKLWLIWDSLEGVKAGIQDTERQIVDHAEQAIFNLETFLSLKSSGWFLIESGQTLFLPGNYAHKVLTLEKYLGVGGFFVSYPSLLNTYTRWLGRVEEFDFKEPLYRRRHGKEFANYIEYGVCEVSKTIGSIIKSQSSQRKKWGLDFLKLSIDTWQANLNDTRLMLSKDVLRCKNILTELSY